MFRSRKSSSKNESVSNSSLSSGNASIQRPSSPVVEPIYTSTYDEEYHKNEIIDLQAPATREDLTIESMSAVIAAAVQMSSAGGAPSSLSLGSASILQPFSKTDTTINERRRFSTRLFSNPWKRAVASPTSPSTPTTPGLEQSSPFDSTITDDDSSSQGSPRTSSASSPTKNDDGRDELLYRGIQIKEIKTTLKTLVISDEARCPMPEIRIERPGFARINY